MGSVFNRKLPVPKEIKEQFPVPEKVAQKKAENDEVLKKIFTGEDKRFLAIIGPCSADNPEAVLDYVHRLAKVQEEVKDKVFIVPRIYTNKPRTTGKGYKGMLHQPDPEKESDLLNGLLSIRSLFVQIMEETGFPISDEMLYPENTRYFTDCLSYVAVGARSVEDQQHRLTASGMLIPVGMKNPTSGDISIMLNSIEAAQSSHNFIYRGWDVETTGNPYAHAILRGACDKDGKAIPNYYYEDMLNLYTQYVEKGFANPSLIVDCNHYNSGKKYKEQIRIAKDVLYHKSHSDDLHDFIKGLMIESYIEEGNQSVDEHTYGKSITDPCIGWDDTEYLLKKIADELD